MNEIEKQKLQTTSQFYKYHPKFLKRTSQFFVISVSLLSFVLSYASGISHLFLYKFHFSTLLFPLFTFTLERKHMFLICNGIVAVLLKNLSFTSSSPSGYDHAEEITKTSEDGLRPAVLSEIEPYEDKEATTESSIDPLDKITGIEEMEEEEEETKENEGLLGIQEEGRESPALITGYEVEEEEEEDDDEKELEESGPLNPPLAEDEGNDIVSTEELNRKIEEFIRKMKEEIRIEAQQPLIAV